MREVPPKIQPKEERVPRETPINLWDNWAIFALFTILIIRLILSKAGLWASDFLLGQ